MGTPSLIGVCNEDGSVTTTYCHYDGYLAHNGRVLVEHYNTPERARAVAEAGYLSGLEYDLEESIRSSVNRESTRTYDSVGSYMWHAFRETCAHYIYLFDGDAWFYATRSQAFEEVEMNLESA
jgi:hypothetical protein